VNGEVLALFDAGDHAGAKRLLTEAIRTYGEQDLLFYNLACAEAQLGETDAALDHLATAITARPAFAESAREDPDLVSLRGTARFAEVVVPT
jgi:tetratricopeptide (TPR) repeat protein